MMDNKIKISSKMDFNNIENKKLTDIIENLTKIIEKLENRISALERTVRYK